MSAFIINTNYTVMSNRHLRDMNLSLKARGLMSLMLSLPDDWDFTLKGLTQLVREGIDAIRAAMQELEKFGYIERRRVRNDKGQLCDTEYVIHEYPVENRQKKEQKKEPAAERVSSAVPEKQDTDEVQWLDRYEQYTNLVKSNIDYDTLIHSYDKAIVDEIVSVMAEVLTVDTEYYTIEGRQYPAEIVRKRFTEVNYGKLDAFLLGFKRRTGRIRNIKGYLISSLFNVAATADLGLENMVMSDLYGDSSGK